MKFGWTLMPNFVNRGTEETKLAVIFGHYLDTMVNSGCDPVNLVIEEPSNRFLTVKF